MVKNIPKLITLGDSATHGNYTWAKHLSSCLHYDLINIAESASSNELQIKLMQDFLLDKNITENDIIVWEIGISWRPQVRIKIDDDFKKIQRMDRLLNRKGLYHYISKSKNKFDNEYRIDLLDISPMRKDFIDKNKTDEMNILQELLFMFIMLKKMNVKLLVFRGRKDFVTDEYWENIKQFFIKKDIQFVEEALGDWCEERQLPFLEDNMHPNEDSQKKFSVEVIFSTLKKLNWV